MPDTITNFWARVKRRGPDDCWEWQGPRLPQSLAYGRCSTHLGNGYAHRAAYELEYGAIPDGLFVLHRCDNPPCCNVEHLFLGTHADNMCDRNEKGRCRKAWVWTPEVVEEMRALREAGVSRPEVAARFDTTPEMVSRLASIDERRRQTHCKNGHPLSGENLYLKPTTGKRSCRACAAVSRRRYIERTQVAA